MSRVVKSTAKCPKCKSRNLSLIELWRGHTIQWEQVNGEFDRDDGILEPGDPYKLEAKCKECGHKWTISKATQIDYVTITSTK